MILSQPNDIALLIAVIGSHGSRVKGRTRLQKEVCILKHQDKIPFAFGFKSYYYGPYSSQLADVVDTLVATGLVRQSVKDLHLDMSRYDYELTEKGKHLLGSIEEQFQKSNPKLLSELVNSVRKLEEMTLSEVVSAAKQCSGLESSD